MAACWEMRGCDEEMQSRCPHNLAQDPCPADCTYSACFRPAHKPTQDVLMLLNPDLNYDAANKEVCRVCENFLVHGPAMTDLDRQRTKEQGRGGNPNRFLL